MLNILSSLLGSIFAIKLFTSNNIIDYALALIAIYIIIIANKRILISPYHTFLNMFIGVSIGVLFTPVFFFIFLYLTNTDLEYENLYFIVSIVLSALVSFLLRRVD